MAKKSPGSVPQMPAGGTPPAGPGGPPGGGPMAAAAAAGRPGGPPGVGPGGVPPRGKSTPGVPNYQGLAGAGQPSQAAMGATQAGMNGMGIGPSARKSPVSVPNMPQQQVNPQQLASQMRSQIPAQGMPPQMMR